MIRGQLATFKFEVKINSILERLLKRMIFNKIISKPHFIAYKSDDMPNKFVNKYKGKKPVLVWYVRTQKSKFVDNIIFEFFTQKRVEK